MPVVVECFHCTAILELDDGFRGGVCRCSTCGSLLQVPKGEADAPPKAKRVRPAVPPGPAVPPAKSDESTGISSGALDPRRADPGISSGLIHKTSPIAMAAKPARKTPPPPEPPAATPPSPSSPPAPEKTPGPQSRGLLIVSVLLILLIGAVLAGTVVVYLRQNP